MPVRSVQANAFSTFGHFNEGGPSIRDRWCPFTCGNNVAICSYIREAALEVPKS